MKKFREQRCVLEGKRMIEKTLGVLVEDGELTTCRFFKPVLWFIKTVSGFNQMYKLMQTTKAQMNHRLLK